MGRLFFSFFFALLLLPAWGQEISPMISFDSNSYGAGNQNWMITQAPNNNLYFANSSGLLEYNGAEWSLYPMPNQTVVRSVEAVGDLIFTGAYMDIGYWKADQYGQLQYTSLAPLFPDAIHEGEQFWHMERIGEVLVFQSFEGLYTYHLQEQEVRRWEMPNNASISNLFKVGSSIYIQLIEQGLFAISKGKLEQVIEYELLEDLELMHVYKKNGLLHFITQSGQFYTWNGDNMQEQPLNLPPDIGEPSIFTALDLSDGSLVLGSIENGLFYLDPQGNLLQHLNQEKGFLNNTVLSIFLDADNNLWAGLDNGLSVINLETPYKIFRDFKGDVGSVYTSFQGEDYFYIGTNQGLYYREKNASDFHFIAGTSGQVWSLQMLDGMLLCGHNKGTFLIEETKAKLVSPTFGTWTVNALSGHPGYYLQGHYNGFSLLKKEGQDIRPLPLTNGFSHSSKFIVSRPDGNIWIGHEHNGVFRIQLDSSLTGISEVTNYSFDSISGITSSLFDYRDQLYYSTSQAIYQYQEETDRFVTDNPLAALFKGTDRISGRLVPVQNEELWAFGESSLYKVDQNPLEPGYRLERVPLPENLWSITRGYENIQLLEDDTYLMGLANGYFKYDQTQLSLSQKSVRIDQIQKSAIDQKPQLVSKQGEAAFHHKSNNIHFSFSTPSYKEFLVPTYSYRLLGLSDQWSQWGKPAMATFENLPYGAYEFQVRAKLGETISPVVPFNFEIARPWYLSIFALILYVILFALLLLLVHRLYKRRHEKLIEENQRELRMKNLEAERQLIRLQNEQLEKDVASKNKEVAISAMSLIKKNEVLARVREELVNSEKPAEVRGVVRSIEKEISEEDNWNFFREAFNNADKDFFRAVKAKHPELTANDLKLCAYLRLNLSSKEIAPLLNISVKSVEIRRYRLRKKMELPRKTNLTEYILQI